NQCFCESAAAPDKGAAAEVSAHLYLLRGSGGRIKCHRKCHGVAIPVNGTCQCAIGPQLTAATFGGSNGFQRRGVRVIESRGIARQITVLKQDRCGAADLIGGSAEIAISRRRSRGIAHLLE